jgi:hypothetical protein
MALTRASAAVVKTEEIVGTRNRIINGAMEIDQRNAGAEVNPATHNGYQLDRWTTFMDALNKFKIQQVTTSPPSGFTHYVRLTVTNAYTSSSEERFALNQKIEGYNLIDLDYGTGTAKPLTLSFWVRSSLTGTFGGTIHNEGGSAYKFPFTYTISSANTWEKKTISISPLTAEAMANKTTSTGMRVWFDLGSNSTATAGTWIAGNYHTGTGAQKWLSNAGATLDFTGVQLEVGSTATPFERRQFGTELALCQRYFYLLASGTSKGVCTAGAYTSSNLNGVVSFPVSMRTAPTSASTSGTNYYVFYRNGSSDSFNSISLEGATNTSAAIFNNTEISSTAGHAGSIYTDNASAFVAFQAEL